MRVGQAEPARDWMQWSKSRGGERRVEKARHRSRQVRSVKTNASEPLMKGRENDTTMSEPEGYVTHREECRQRPVLFGMASGLKAARARIRLRHGTSEPVVWM